MEVYESHLGGIYFENEVLDWGDLYCDECGDSDRHLGRAESWEDVVEMITDEDGWCPYSEEMMIDLKTTFEVERSE